jgi:hypothetical protein
MARQRGSSLDRLNVESWAGVAGSCRLHSESNSMIRTVEAGIDEHGNVRLEDVFGAIS